MKNGQRKLGLYLCKKWYSLAIPLMVLMGACFCISEPSVSALTTVPTKTNFQGRLTNSSGNVMPDGTYNMKFRLYTVGSGGSAVWSEDRLVSASQGVTLTNGLFSIRLGDVTPIPASLFASGSLYLEVELPTPATATGSSPSWTEGAMTPRNQLATSAYAYNSETLDGFDSADFGKLVASNTWTGSNTFSGPANSFLGDTFSVNTNDNVDIISGSDMFFNAGSIGFGQRTDFNQGVAIGGGGAFNDVLSVMNGLGTVLFSVNKSTSIVRVGDATADATGVVLVLDTKNTAGDPTGVAGAMYYNSSTGKFRCYQVSAWKECGLDTLQDSYTASTGGTTPEIKLDATRGGLDIQDADTTIGASLLAVRGSNGAGLGSALFSVGNTGVVTAQNSTDSTAAFTISRAGAGGSLFVADTTNSRVQIGNAAADATGVVLVLDTKNSAGDPTGVDGAMYYNSEKRSFRCYQNGVWRSCLGGLAYANITPSATITTTTTETDFSTVHTIPAGGCQQGRVYRVTARGIYNSANIALGGEGTIILRVKIGGIPVGVTSAQAMGQNRVNRQWTLDFNITCATYGNPGTVEGQGVAQLFTTAVANTPLEISNNTTIGGINMTVAQNISLSVKYSVSNADNNITLRQMVVEELGP